MEGDINQGTLRETKYDNEAFGIGPGILADLCLWQGKNLSFHFEITIVLSIRYFEADIEGDT